MTNSAFAMNGNPFAANTAKPSKPGLERSLGFLKLHATDNSGADKYIGEMPLRPNNDVHKAIFAKKDSLDDVTFRMDINESATTASSFGGISADIEVESDKGVLGYMNIFAVDKSGIEHKLGYIKLLKKSANHVGIHAARDVLEKIPFGISITALGEKKDFAGF